MNRNRRTEEIGITAPVPKGAWAAWTTYQQLNIVSHNGAAYIAKSANSNVEPGVTNGWDSYWMLLQVSDEIEVDDTLSKAGEAADAAVVGDKFAEVGESLGDINDQITQIDAALNGINTSVILTLAEYQDLENSGQLKETTSYIVTCTETEYENLVSDGAVNPSVVYLVS